MAEKWLKRLAPLIGVAMFVASAWFLYTELHKLDTDRVIAHVRRLPRWRLAAAAACALAGYVFNCGYDWLGLRYVHARVGWRKAAFTGFVGSAFSNAVSLPLAGVAGFRIPLYRQWGLDVRQVFKLVGLVGISGWIGLLAVAGLAWAIMPPNLPWGLPSQLPRAIGAALAATVLVYVVWCTRRRSLRVFNHCLELPTSRVAAGQVLLGAGDWISEGMVLYLLLDPQHNPSVLWFFPVYFASMILAMIAHLPAGLGVLDAGLLVMLQQRVATPDIVGALALYRLFYHLVPLALALMMFGGYEGWRRFTIRIRGPGQKRYAA